MFSLSNHQSTLFQVHPSLRPELSDILIKVAPQFQLNNWGINSDSKFDYFNSLVFSNSTGSVVEKKIFSNIHIHIAGGT